MGAPNRHKDRDAFREWLNEQKIKRLVDAQKTDDTSYIKSPVGSSIDRNGMVDSSTHDHRASARVGWVMPVKHKKRRIKERIDELREDEQAAIVDLDAIETLLRVATEEELFRPFAKNGKFQPNSVEKLARSHGIAGITAYKIEKELQSRKACRQAAKNRMDDPSTTLREQVLRSLDAARRDSSHLPEDVALTEMLAHFQRVLATNELPNAIADHFVNEGVDPDAQQGHLLDYARDCQQNQIDAGSLVNQTIRILSHFTGAPDERIELFWKLTALVYATDQTGYFRGLVMKNYLTVARHLLGVEELAQGMEDVADLLKTVPDQEVIAKDFAYTWKSPKAVAAGGLANALTQAVTEAMREISETNVDQARPIVDRILDRLRRDYPNETISKHEVNVVTLAEFYAAALNDKAASFLKKMPVELRDPLLLVLDDEADDEFFEHVERIMETIENPNPSI